MKTVQPDTILKRNNGIKINLDSMTEIEVSLNGKSDYYNENVLKILDVFARPVSIKVALTKLQTKSTQDWIDLTATITKLYNAGILTGQSKDRFTPDNNPAGFGALPIHIAMLNDKARTETFLQAIKELIKTDDVVLDIGTGTGIFAVAAARAGAKKVYAVEAGEMADAAQSVFQSNNVEEKIKLIHGWSTQIELPEPADVLISEIIGNEPFNERVLQTIKDARRRLLKTDARIIPSRIKTFGIPVSISPDIVSQNIITEKTICDWQTWYEIDFSTLSKISKNTSAPLNYVSTQKAVKLKALCDPIQFCDIDLQTFQETMIDTVIKKAPVNCEGFLNGLLVFFELEIGSKVISTNPHKASFNNHWLNPVWFFENGKSVESNDEIKILYTYNAKGHRNEVRLIEE